MTSSEKKTGAAMMNDMKNTLNVSGKGSDAMMKSDQIRRKIHSRWIICLFVFLAFVMSASLTYAGGAPTMSIVAPVTSETINSIPYTVSGTCSGGTPPYTSVTIDDGLGGGPQPVTGTSSWTYSWSPPDGGPYTLTGACLDSAVKTANATVTGITVSTCSDSDVASWTITTPTEGATISGTSYTITARVDNEGAPLTMGTVEFNLAGAGWSSAGVYNNGVDSFLIDWDTTVPGDGDWTILVRGFDPDCGGTNLITSASRNVTISNSGGPASTITGCDGCHGYPPVDGARSGATGQFVGSHDKHQYACNFCHSSALPVAYNHRNGVIDFRDGTIGNAGGTDNGTYNGGGASVTQTDAPVTTTDTCSNVACHYDVTTPRWGVETTQCNDCHGAPPPGDAHDTHYAAKGWGASDVTGTYCVTCHPDNTTLPHDGVIEVLGALSPSGSGTTTTCGATGIGCHNGLGTPTWGTTPIGCTDCHTVGGSNTATVANPVSGLHGNLIPSVQDHDNTLTGGCTACHVKTSIGGHWNGTASATADYTKAAVGITSAMYTDAGGTAATRGSCFSPSPGTALDSCHSDGGEWRRLWSTDADADIVASKLPGQVVCNVCHGQYSTLTASTGWNEGTVHYRSGAGATEDKGMIHTDAGDECEDCHGYDSAASHNINNKIDMSGGGVTYTLAWGTHLTNKGWYCSTCHDNRTAEDAAASTTHTYLDSLAFPSPTKATPENVVYVSGTSVPEGDCFGCHGDGLVKYWPVNPGNDRDLSTDASFNNDGRHTFHMGILATRLGYNTVAPTDAQQRQMCNYCHQDEDGDHMTKGVGEYADVFPSTTYAKHMNGAADGGLLASYDPGTDTCSNVDCHNSKTSPATYGWYQAGTTTCTMCHTAGGASQDPNSGLHTGAAPTISAQKHDDSVSGGCAACHVMPANSPSTSHINGTFSSDASVGAQKTIMGLDTSPYVTSGTDNTGTCATACHSGAGDNGTWARRWNSAIHYDPLDGDYVECAGCHGGFASDWTFGGDNVVGDGSVSHAKDWEGGDGAEVIGNHPDGTNKCKSCHGFGYAGVYDFATMGAHRDGKITFNDEMNYNPSTYLCGTYCHSNNTGHNLEDSGWATTVGFEVNCPPLACSDCHATAATGSAGVGNDSPHAGNTGFTCEGCHTGHTGGTITIANNTGAGINYGTGGISLGGASTTGTNEQQICNGCHAATYQPWNKTYGGYTTGTLSNYSNWDSATWTSANFSSYKPTAIQSKHYGVAGQACSYCHDVHDTMGPNTGIGGPYLRGTWISNPFPEDGAPSVARPGGNLFTEDADGVPRGLGATGTGSSNALGGWQIEQNNSGAYTRTGSYSTYAGLCQNCHPADTSATGILRAASYSGHAAAVDGLQAGGGNDIYNDTLRGGTNSYARAYMQHNNISTMGNIGSDYVIGLREGRYGTGVYPQVNDPKYSTIGTTWGITIGASSTNVDANFHEFPCSKCHSPHMSALPRLMITNCLDVRHNTRFDNTGTFPAPTTWPGYGVTPSYTAQKLPYASTAANCHRYVSSTDTNRETNGNGGNGEPGWNNVTPW